MAYGPDKLAARFAWETLAPEAESFPAESVRRALVDILPAGRLDAYLDEIAAAPLDGDRTVASSDVVDALSDAQRRRQGIYMTPPDVARGLAASVARADAPLVIDPAAGTGTLLVAALRTNAGGRVVGIEREWPLAVVAAVRIVAERRRRAADDRGADRIHVDDGLGTDAPLARWEGRADAVLLNPPYVGEKGNRELFDAIRETHPHLRDVLGPRCDLAYLFIHRSLSFLRPGGRLAILSPAYWLSATGASDLRADLTDRAMPRAFVRVPSERLFDQAPGHHSLVSVYERTGEGGPDRAEQLGLWESSATDEETPSREQRVSVACTLEEMPRDWERLVGGLVQEGTPAPNVDGEIVRRPASEFDAGNWSPFARVETAEWGRRLRRVGTPLGELLEDRQGFVSGADRVTNHRLAQLDEVPDDIDAGDPLFVWARDELTDAMQTLEGLVVRPLLRGSDLEPDEVRIAPPDAQVALYLDDELAEDQGWVVDPMRPLRPALETRREVRQDAMPWYRLHWPRSRREQTLPKLVVPRRAERPRFALDVSASVVSSDCTYLLAPASVRHPIRYLHTLMLVLNQPYVERYLRHFGKRKGDLLEFYSEPLRSLPMPLELRWGELEWTDPAAFGIDREDLEARVESASYV